MMYKMMYTAYMNRMIRKQVYIEPEQEELLKQRARELGVSEAELIRRGIKDVGRLSAALSLDRSAWEAELRFLHKRARDHKALRSRRKWTREELYEERLQRLSR